jgi:hypothetical protein
MAKKMPFGLPSYYKMTTAEIEDLENKICDLVSSAKFFNELTREMNKLYSKHRSDPKRNIFTLHSNIYFRYVISVFRTLFETAPSPREQSFGLWRKKREEQEEEMKDFKKISELYKQSNLKTFRDKIIDHRDNNNAGDAVRSFLTPVKDEFVIISSEIISKLEDHIKKYFNDPGYNFYSFYSPSMDRFISILNDQSLK